MTKKILGYVFEFKGSSSDCAEKNTVSIKFTSGISDKYPKEFENKKDFYCETICVGDYHELFANDQAVEQQFAHFLKENEHPNEWDYYNELFEEQSDYFQGTDIDFEKYLVLKAFSYMHTNFAFAHQTFSSGMIDQLLKPFNLSESTYTLYQDIRMRIYHDELEQAFNGMRR